MGQALSVWAGQFTHQLICYIGEVQNLKWYDPIYDNQLLSNLNFWSPAWEQNGNGKQVVDLKILWSNEDNFGLAGPNPNRLLSVWASIPFTR